MSEYAKASIELLSENVDELKKLLDALWCMCGNGPFGTQSIVRISRKDAGRVKKIKDKIKHALWDWGSKMETPEASIMGTASQDFAKGQLVNNAPYPKHREVVLVTSNDENEIRQAFVMQDNCVRGRTLYRTYHGDDGPFKAHASFPRGYRLDAMNLSDEEVDRAIADGAPDPR